ncbi:MAG: hypothetical protein AVDCRST_MAG67-643, partial [uncultured Solirubrobacteraceae bacterium]
DTRTSQAGGHGSAPGMRRRRGIRRPQSRVGPGEHRRRDRRSGGLGGLPGPDGRTNARALRDGAARAAGRCDLAVARAAMGPARAAARARVAGMDRCCGHDARRAAGARRHDRRRARRQALPAADAGDLHLRLRLLRRARPVVRRSRAADPRTATEPGLGPRRTSRPIFRPSTGGPM